MSQSPTHKGATSQRLFLLPYYHLACAHVKLASGFAIKSMAMIQSKWSRTWRSVLLQVQAQSISPVDSTDTKG